MSSIGTPRSSAAIWEKVVTWLWPCGVVPIIISTLPVGRSLMVAASQPPAAFLLLGAQLLVPDQLQGAVQGRSIVARVRIQPTRDGGRLGEWGREVQPADLDRILPHLA